MNCNTVKPVLRGHLWNKEPEALKSLYRSPGNKKKQLVLCKNYVLRHLGITINIKNIKFVEDLPMIIPGQFEFNCPSGFREEAF
jgi:predicted aldo/keto reductase-like oxidoreductase